MKTCSKCKLLLDKDCFYKQVTGKDGLHCWCKSCDKSITPERRIWNAMKQRCTNPKCKAYKNYGGRGIKILYQNFTEFFADVGPRPSPELAIDRIDNDGNYEPGNCKWSTMKEQNNNKRNRRPATDETKKKISKAIKDYWNKKKIHLNLRD